MFKDSSENIDSIKRKIDSMAEQVLEEYIIRKKKQGKFIDVVNERAEHIKKDYGIEFDSSKIDRFISRLLKQHLSKEEIDKRFEAIDESIKEESRKKAVEKLVKSGTTSSNFSDIKETITILFDDEFLSTVLSIYGGTVPYLITDEEPKRIIDDVDTHARLEDMGSIRRHILKNQDKYHIVSDSLQLCGEDYGIELSVNGVNVSIFPTIATNEGMIVRNFSIQESLKEITTKSTLFGGIDEDKQIINYDLNGRNIRILSPEFTYITKDATKREKDIIDNQVLSKVIDNEKLQQMSLTMIKPEIIEKQTRIINCGEKLI